ncbi:MAG: hypothetical protein IJA34_10985 [Lachnospiraceae bacterium]|nr:hypothetical protein [Lachnospiraceae bacterium]
MIDNDKITKEIHKIQNIISNKDEIFTCKTIISALIASFFDFFFAKQITEELSTASPIVAVLLSLIVAFLLDFHIILIGHWLIRYRKLQMFEKIIMYISILLLLILIVSLGCLRIELSPAIYSAERTANIEYGQATNSMNIFAIIQSFIPAITTFFTLGVILLDNSHIRAKKKIKKLILKLEKERMEIEGIPLDRLKQFVEDDYKNAMEEIDGYRLGMVNYLHRYIVSCNPNYETKHAMFTEE